MSTNGPSRQDGRGARPLPELMATIVHGRSTGILGITDGSIRRELLFVDGELRAARSSSEKEKLGTWLVQKGLISEDEKALTLLKQGAAEAPPLGHLLVERGCVDQETLERELEELAMTIIRRSVSSPRAAAELIEGRTSTQPDTLPNLTTQQLLLIAAREYRDTAAIRASLEPLEQLAWPSTSLDTLLTELDLTPKEAYLMSRLNGRHTLKELCSILPMSEDEILGTVYALRIAGAMAVGMSSGEDPLPLRTGSSQPVGSGEHIAVVDEDKLTDDQRAERMRIRQLAERCLHMGHYDALGLDPSARWADIGRAWEKIHLEFNPERSSEPHLRDLRPELATIVDRAREAYDVLSDPAARKRYDRVVASLVEEGREAAGHTTRPTSARARAELVEANIKRAQELVHDGEPYLAIKLLEQACDIDPRPEALLQLARLLMRNPLWRGKALKTIRRAIEVDPNSSDAWVELAEFWRRRRDSERQRKALEKALAADPDDARAAQMYQQMLGQRELERLLRRARSRQR